MSELKISGTMPPKPMNIWHLQSGGFFGLNRLFTFAVSFGKLASVSTMLREEKRKPGRPKKHGVRPGWMLLRDNIALNAYDEARRAGEKHEAALDLMVEAVHSWNAEMPMSRTAAKRILAEWRGKEKASTILGRGEQVLRGEGAALYLERIYDLHVAYAELKGLPKPPRPTSTTVRILAFGIGPSPRYKRINSKERQ